MGRAVVNKNDLQEFYRLTRFDIQGYFESFSLFMKTDYNALANYFSGKTEKISLNSVSNLNKLLASNDQLFSLYTETKSRLNNYKWWELMDQIEEIQTSLQTVSNLGKWLRSPRTNNAFNTRPEVTLTLKQNQTLEQLNKNTLGNSDWENSWVDTARRNDLKEEDYSLDGGNMLKVTFFQGDSIILNGVVDYIQGEKIFGLDIDKKLTFENNDLKVLGYKETFKQSIDILSNLEKGDNPYLPNDGIDTRSVLGTNVNIVNFPSIFRQMSQVFATDDTVKEISVVDIKRKSDALYVDFSVKSRIGDTQAFSIQLSN